MRWTPKKMRWLINFYPPYLGAGIKVTHIQEDWHAINVSMKLRFYNKNIVGTQFGGSLYAMTDPHYMIMLMMILGKDYVVWDKAAEIDFIRPGKGAVHAHMHLSKEIVEDVRQKTASGDKYLPVFNFDITDDTGEVIASVCKTVYVRRKRT